MTDTPSILHGHRYAWQNKPSLREVYHDLYQRIVQALRPGETLEIGGGTGNFKDYSRDVISSDIQFASWLDVLFDAHQIPFADASFDNIVIFDVLHHLERPVLFLKEASRILREKGRIIMVEPAITPISNIFYTYFHPEDVDMRADPFSEGQINPNRNPYESNQAIPTLLFKRRPEQLTATFPELNALQVDYLSMFAYPLSGGFRPWSLIPAGLVKLVLKMEDSMLPALGPAFAFRLFTVLERR